VVATDQTALPTDNFSGSEIATTIIPFTVTPSTCKVLYNCDSITRTDNAATNLGCEDFAFDGVLDGGLDDGKISITITPDDYINNVYSPGTFEMTICGVVEDSTS
jgi:hypothetical protein